MKGTLVSVFAAAMAAGAGVAAGQAPPPDVVIHADTHPSRSVSEFDVWNDPASPGGKLLGVPNSGGDLDPPPEDDPNARFKVRVLGGVPYRCWVHMKVGPAKGKALANRVWVQFTNAVDERGAQTLKPGTASYLTAQGPTQQGWTWVGCDGASGAALVRFAAAGEVTVRVQAGMEGVGFDQFLLSPAQFLEHPPAEAVVKK